MHPAAEDTLGQSHAGKFSGGGKKEGRGERASCVERERERENCGKREKRRRREEEEEEKDRKKEGRWEWGEATGEEEKKRSCSSRRRRSPIGPGRWLRRYGCGGLTTVVKRNSSEQLSCGEERRNLAVARGKKEEFLQELQEEGRR